MFSGGEYIYFNCLVLTSCQICNDGQIKCLYYWFCYILVLIDEMIFNPTSSTRNIYWVQHFPKTNKGVETVKRLSSPPPLDQLCQPPSKIPHHPLPLSTPSKYI